jgi:hypothetical protein
VGIRLANRLDAETDRIRREARRAGSTEERRAHMADALASLVDGSGGGRSGRAEVVFVCDLRAFVRRHAETGEPSTSSGAVPCRWR